MRKQLPCGLVAATAIFFAGCGPLCLGTGNHHRTRGTFTLNRQLSEILASDVLETGVQPDDPRLPPVLRADGAVEVDVDVKANRMELRYRLNGDDVIERYKITDIDIRPQVPNQCTDS